MHVGGSVWALEWCPRVHENPDARAKCEFLAVATHPPDSYSHKIGVRLSGRGIIQIWCIINATCENDSTYISGKKQKLSGKSQKKPSDESNNNNTEPKKPRGRPRKHPIETETEPKKPKGRPRKKTTAEPPIELDCDVLYVEALSVRYPEEAVVPATPPRVLREASVTKAKTNNESSGKGLPSESANIKLPVRRKRQKQQPSKETGTPMLSEDSEDVGNVPGKPSSDISEDIALPRVVLCLAHNGKVAWDMKWRPSSADDSLNKHRMGYLAVLLGNGSLEVWDVPMPRAVSAVYLSSKKDATDPRFVKLAPVFKCSNLKCGDTQSIPLTVEWSTLGNPDFLLAGCHDGTVALWKFSTTKSSQDTRPLLFFSADTTPIRAVAWAPSESFLNTTNKKKQDLYDEYIAAVPSAVRSSPEPSSALMEVGDYGGEYYNKSSYYETVPPCQAVNTVEESKCYERVVMETSSKSYKKTTSLEKKKKRSTVEYRRTESERVLMKTASWRSHAMDELSSEEFRMKVETFITGYKKKMNCQNGVADHWQNGVSRFQNGGVDQWQNCVPQLQDQPYYDGTDRRRHRSRRPVGGSGSTGSGGSYLAISN
ncbi:hypothetical protein F2Q70_00040235 [Brassica cretica]|uniref:Uncharacterized protein n=1 Tax=Brassica cretica TaxID=69181 RepID=A0A8S9K1W1_BRACR|nr:hypothetical protein F2Q70_00040235 [Brassica cretica]